MTKPTIRRASRRAAAILAAAALVFLAVRPLAQPSHTIASPISIALPNATLPPQQPPSEVVDVVRDSQGVPHIFATTANGAFYGAGYACAQDRLFQMNFLRWSMRGRLAEYLGNQSPFDLTVSLDMAARYIGWGPHADALAANIADQEASGILTAYAQGVNYFTTQYMQTHGTLPPAFQSLNIASIDQWTPADSILCWTYIQAIFENAWTGEIDYATCTTSSCPPDPYIIPDPTGAVTTGPWTPPTCIDDLRRKKGGFFGCRPDFRKASHNLVLSGPKCTNGAAVMLAKPQLLVTNPSILYEFAAKGGSYDFRGAGIPGCPGLLVGWNRNICWSVTAMGGDTSDLYRLSFPNGIASNTYLLDGNPSKPMTNVHTETILIKNGGSTGITHRETVFGPDVTQLVVSRTSETGPGYSLCHQILRDKDHHTVEAMLGLMKATMWCEARTAMRKWRGPGVHMLYGDVAGNIGYTAVVALPTRPANDPCHALPGSQPQDGTTIASTWNAEVQFDSLPWALNPAAGFLSTANNLAADPATTPGNAVYGSPGDSDRSWRLRELMTGLLNDPTNPNYPNIQLTPDQILAIDHDSVSPMMRATAELAALMVSANALTGNALSAAQKMGRWNIDSQPPQYWQMLPSVHIYPLLTVIAGYVGAFHYVPGQSWNNLILTYGDGASGAVAFLKDAEAHLTSFAANPDVIAWMQNRLDAALTDFTTNPPTGVDSFTVLYGANAKLIPLSSGGAVNLLPYGYTVTLPAPYISSIWSQTGECYKFHIPMRNVDDAMSMLPPGVSEDFTSQYLYRNHEANWISGVMYGAPITQSQITPHPQIPTITLAY
jgi:penicillin amidase